jgi:hypothetical protein
MLTHAYSHAALPPLSFQPRYNDEAMRNVVDEIDMLYKLIFRTLQNQEYK